ncbi:hypothetical protein D3C80_1973130 [compost metagenome]
MNGGVLGNKIADPRYQQALHDGRVRINSQVARQLTVFNIKNFLIQRIEGAA